MPACANDHPVQKRLDVGYGLALLLLCRQDCGSEKSLRDFGIVVQGW
jgi:hypothetical protein